MIANTPQLIVEMGFSLGASQGNYFTVGDEARGIVGVGAVAPASEPVWTDVTDYVQNLSLTPAGSSRMQGPLVVFEAGTARILLDNSGRTFDPLNEDSPYYVPEQTILVAGP